MDTPDRAPQGWRRRLGAQGSFTLIELLVVILIIAILLAIAAPSFLGQTHKASDSAAQQYLTIAYRSAAAATPDYSGDFGGPTGDAQAAQRMASAIAASEPELTVEVGSCPVDATSDPKHIVVAAAGAGDLELCNAYQSGSEHVVWTLTVVDHQLQPFSTSTQTGTGTDAPRVSAYPTLTDSRNPLSHVQVGDSLTVDPGSWTNSPSFSYQWQTSTDGSNWTNVGSDSSSYVVPPGTEGDYVRAVVTGTNAGGERSAASDATGAVLPHTPVNDSGDPPLITDSDQPGGATDHVQVSDHLQATTGSWSDSPTGYAFQWQSSTNGGTWTDLAGATSSDYTVPAAVDGLYLRVTVQATNSGGTGSASSDPTAPVLPATPVNQTLPTYSGSTQVGHQLTATSGGWSNNPTSYSYQWQHSANGSDWTDASGTGATAQVYTVDSSDYGDYLQVCVTASNSGGAADACSGVPAGAGAAAPVAPTLVTPPVVDRGGNPIGATAPQVGDTLTATDGTWSSQDPSLTYTYQWQTSPDGSTWTDATGAGAQSSSYTVASADLGLKLQVVVTAHDSYGGQSAAASDATVVTVSAVPVGTVVAYAGTSAPSGWLLANGQAVSRTTYAGLYAVIGTSYGSGDGSTTFNVPNLTGRLPLGADGSHALASQGGQLDQTGSLQPWGTLTESFSWSETPPAPAGISHNHGVPGAQNTYGQSGGGGNDQGTGYTSASVGSSSEGFTTQSTSVSTSAALTPTATTSVANPPYTAVNYLIEAQQSATGIPCGALVGFGGASLPAGAGQADGATSSPCVAAAFSGTLPDLRGRFPLGADGSHVLGSQGGTLTQTVSASLPAAQTQTTVSPSWSATLVEGSHTHSFALSGGVHMSHDYNWNGGYSATSWSSSSSANSNAGATYSSGTYAPGALAVSGAGVESPSSAGFTTAYQALTWIGYSADGHNPAPGTITPFAGASVPDGWLLADGSCVSQSTYAGLYAAIGSSYGSCAAGQFKLPDLAGRFPLGADGTHAAGASGGSLSPAPSLTFAGWTPSFTVPVHGFSWTVPAHTHTVTVTGAYTNGNSSGTPQTIGSDSSGSHSYTTSAGGGGSVSSTTASPYSVSASAVAPATASPAVAPPAYRALAYIVKY